MSKTTNSNSTNNAQPETETTVEGQAETITAAVQAMPADTAENVVEFQGRKGGTNGFAAFIAKRTGAVQNKVQLTTEARKLLTIAAEAVAAGGEEAAKADEPAAKGGLLLFQGMSQGVLSNDEVTEILGSTFGWKMKQKGGQSKTPLGKGEEIRKRVGRVFKAYDYAIAGNEPVAFFEPLEREDVAPLVNSVIEGNLGLWEFYNKSGELKAEKTGKRPKLAFDPRRIAALTRDLGESVQNTVAIIQRTPGLFAAYAGLLQIINTVGQEIPEPATETEAA